MQKKKKQGRSCRTGVSVQQLMLRCSGFTKSSHTQIYLNALQILFFGFYFKHGGAKCADVSATHKKNK